MILLLFMGGVGQISGGLGGGGLGGVGRGGRVGRRHKRLFPGGAEDEVSRDAQHHGQGARGEKNLRGEQPEAHRRGSHIHL